MARLEPLWTRPPLTDPDAIAAFLAERGVHFERWPVPDAIHALASRPSLDAAEREALLDAFRPSLEAKARDHGYASADVVALRPDLPGVDDALARFDRVHCHDDDEVRAIVAGRGVFGFSGDDGRQFLLEVESGEYLSVPAGVWHWFYCGPDRFITALRLFRDPAGWIARYRPTDRGTPGAGP